MVQKPDTEPFSEVPGHSRLSQRGSTFYLRVAVPEKLRPLFGWELKWPLQVNTRREARLKINYDSALADALIEQARRILGPGGLSPSSEAFSHLKRCLAAEKKPSARLNLLLDVKTDEPSQPRESSGAKQALTVTSEQHSQDMAKQWFVQLERDSKEWWDQRGFDLQPEDRNELLFDLALQEGSITGKTPNRNYQVQKDDGSGDLEAFLEAHNLTVDRTSLAYRQLAVLFRDARLEHLRRSADRLRGNPFTVYDPLFSDVTAHSLPKQLNTGITVAKLGDKFATEFEKSGKAPKTLFQYRVTIRLLSDVFGADRAAASITREDAEKFCEVIETMPENMAKRYPGMSAVQAIAAAEKKGDSSRLAANTKRNRFFVAFSIFKYGVKTKQIPENPFDDYLFKQRFTPKNGANTGSEDAGPFTMEELNTIFRAPLFTGCADDEWGYAKPGPNKPRRGRFYVPLIALFQGMRCNEICQLYVEDVKDWEGGLCLEIRVDLDGGAADDKRLKNKPSGRTIPVHPELIKLGFGDYVTQRRADGSRRLFPELTRANTGSYSDNFSKFFGRFLGRTFGKKIAATFHSFRHSFTDALKRADISPQRIDRLCGWAGEGQQQRHYGRDRLIGQLAEELAKVHYPNLDIAHLYPR